jgi:hypothetical protein
MTRAPIWDESVSLITYSRRASGCVQFAGRQLHNFSHQAMQGQLPPSGIGADSSNRRRRE